MTASAEAVPLPAEAVLPGRWEMVAHRGLQHLLDASLAIGAGCVTGLLAGLVATPLVRWGTVPPMTILWAPFITFCVVMVGCDLLIHVWVPLRRGGVTPGMLVVGLRIETTRGGAPGVRDYLVRWFLFTVDGLLLGLVAVVSIAVTGRRQRVGDLLARTVVVRVS
ncbi:RDD family protein [Actinophytocola algeriensis]|uniref:Putative RDD family membrane protein YckC n=1 Tax=Actinophytocola algeriensis TaxID=1768010 RepID=A0A7W7Q8I1_9PSEU|nr:RDD family protein [Actinophytocola algeriensis]MBB4908823.1 putative RDD family membrane protein YckC [Actinophytocola algeriensis]MBE1474790.1 putative RDD family membrane protein YckC [Actinophytocola algeriensis]